MKTGRGSFDVTSWNEETYEEGDGGGKLTVETSGEFDGTVASCSWTVIAGSDTGDLEGLRGIGSFRAPHGSHAEGELDVELA